MIHIYNDYIEVSHDDPAFFPLSTLLEKSGYTDRKVFKKKNGKTTSRNRRFYWEECVFSRIGNSIYVPRGLYSMLWSNGYFSKSITYDKTISTINIDVDLLKDMSIYRSMLDGIELRPEQLLSIRKMIILKRCIIQMGTGAGKTEIMCGFIKLMSNLLGYVPTTILIENNVNLVNSTINRLSKYNIECADYRSNRSISLNTVNVCHPTSLNNDIKKGTTKLDKIKIFLADECHHLIAATNQEILKHTSVLEYSIGLSASAIDQSHVMSRDIKEFSIPELKIIGMTGSVAVNITAGSLIKQNKLAVPVLVRIDNEISHKIPDSEIQNWHRTQDDILLSKERNDLICICAKFFTDKNRKVLILVNTIKWSQLLLKMLSEYGLSNISRGSYGGGRFEKYNPDINEFEDCSQDNVLDKYSNGDIRILIGTSHIYEGFDVPNLDVIILAYGGKKDRLQIQGIGRSLRLTKTGKYAWIIDFCDSNNPVLSRQSNIRLERYKEDIGITDDRLFEDVYIQELPDIFSEFEEE